MADDVTFRPTVKLRCGQSVGSGTIIAFDRGEALILTAAHVVTGEGDLAVELHRYNLGVEKTQPGVGWPRIVAAEVVHADLAADVALVRVSNAPRLPYVARLADDRAPRLRESFTSFGIDQGTSLNRWRTKLRGTIRLDRGDGEHLSRPFLVTEKAPEQGRSGGGLFRDDGRLIGVCVGRIESVGGPTVGLFAAPESIRALLADVESREVLARHPSLSMTAGGGERPR